MVWVPLDRRGDRWTMVDAADYDALPATLRNVPWCLNSNGRGRDYVKAHSALSSGGLVIIARVVLGAGWREAVSYASPDRTDLRRSNISLERSTKAKRDHLSEVLRAAA